jgi:hypothetical protein
MRSASIPLDIPPHLVKQARLFAARGDDLQAVCHVLEDYGRLVAEVRQLRARVSQLDQEGAFLDARLTALQDACRAILKL